MAGSERPRRPAKVIVFVLALWIVGGTVQSAFGSLVASSGVVEAGTAPLVGLILGWGLVCAVCYRYREHLETWLRS